MHGCINQILLILYPLFQYCRSEAELVDYTEWRQWVLTVVKFRVPGRADQGTISDQGLQEGQKAEVGLSGSSGSAGPIESVDL